MQNPVYSLKAIIDTAIDLHEAAMGYVRPIASEELLEMGRAIKKSTVRLIDTAWYRTDPKGWEEQHQGNVGTSL